MTWLLAIGGFLKRVPWWAYAAAAVLFAGWCYGNARYYDGRADELAKWEAAAAKAKARADKATVTASEQRATDIIRNTTIERARTDAIAKNPDDPRLGLNCARLRQAGIDPPPACAGR